MRKDFHRSLPALAAFIVAYAAMFPQKVSIVSPASAQSHGEVAPPTAVAPVTGANGAAPTVNSPTPGAQSAAAPNAASPAPTAAAPVPEENGNAGYSFNPLAVKRDPFTPPLSAGGNLGDLRRFDLNEMQLVAVLSGMGSPQAMIVLPNKTSHIVQVGTAIGRRNGKVFKIKSNEVVIKESFTDYQKRVKSELTSLVIAP